MGPLSGIKVIELQGIGPGPFCGMMLSDMGATVVRVDRAANVPAETPSGPSLDVLARGRQSIAVDLKQPEGVETVLRLIEGADALIEGFRPGVMERLGLGPDVCLGRNPKLVYGRMTGWGQEGPYAQMAGHDINYIALGGVLAHIGRAGEAPLPPLNLVGDFGGGGMLLAFGMACGLVEAKASGKGQVVDAAMVDGSAILMTMFAGMLHGGAHSETRGTNLLDTGSHFYDVYRTADDRYISLGSIEPQFYAELLRLSGLGEQADLPPQMDRSQWPAMKERVAALIATKTSDEWCAIMEGSDVCFAPVLTMAEAARHPHNAVRQTYVEVDGISQPAPAPRFSRTEVAVAGPPAWPGQHTADVLKEFGFTDDETASLRASGAVR
ncbi:MAG: CaiB/BaiF CoA transferase family protein [Acidimicrobiales bacterium]